MLHDVPPNRGSGILALGILGVVSLIGSAVFVPAFLMSLIFGPLAWGMGLWDLGGIRKGKLAAEGKSLVLAGCICGMTTTALASLVIMAFLWVAKAPPPPPVSY